MPKIVSQPKSKTQIQAESDARRGIKNKAFKLHETDIAFIIETAKALNMNQNELVMTAIRAYAKQSGV